MEGVAHALDGGTSCSFVPDEDEGIPRDIRSTGNGKGKKADDADPSSRMTPSRNGSLF